MKVAAIMASGGLMGLAVAVWAGNGVGSQAATWLTLPDSARGAALGGASAALDADVDVLNVNPAGLAGLSGINISMLHEAYVQDTSLEHLACGIKAGQGALGVSFDYMNYGSIPESQVTNGSLVSNSTLNPFGEVVRLGYAYPLGQLEVGVAGEGVMENLTGADTDETAAGNIGILWKDSEDGISLGVAGQNLGGNLAGANLPAQCQVGIGYRTAPFGVAKELFLSANGSIPFSDTTDTLYSVGAELSGDIWVIRLGYRFADESDTDGFAVGGGLRFKHLRLDYAFNGYGVLGDANLFSLGIRL
jgi:hypothetical protein